MALADFGDGAINFDTISVQPSAATVIAEHGGLLSPGNIRDDERADRRSVRARSRCIGWLLAIEDATVRGKLQFAVPDLMQRPKVAPAQLVG